MFGKLNGNTAFMSTSVPYYIILSFIKQLFVNLALTLTVGSLDSD